MKVWDSFAFYLNLLQLFHELRFFVIKINLQLHPPGPELQISTDDFSLIVSSPFRCPSLTKDPNRIISTL